MANNTLIPPKGPFSITIVIYFTLKKIKHIQYYITHTYFMSNRNSHLNSSSIYRKHATNIKSSLDTYVNHIADDLFTCLFHVIPLDIPWPAQHSVPAEELIISPSVVKKKEKKKGKLEREHWVTLSKLDGIKKLEHTDWQGQGVQASCNLHYYTYIEFRDSTICSCLQSSVPRDLWTTQKSECRKFVRGIEDQEVRMRSGRMKEIAAIVKKPWSKHLEGYPAALILTVSSTPHARNCWMARVGSNVKAILSSLGLMQRT